ncbi:MAG: hypothetical protein IJT70_07230, partial [Clostridia bacterium]|nr:hypothetical protein [Clostridia bacterium]
MSKLRSVSTNKALLVLGALVCVLAMVLTAVLMIPRSYAEAPATIQINSAADLVKYASEYAGGQHNPDDTIQLALSQGTAFYISSSDYPSFAGIGTEGRPFNGKIEIADNAVSNFFLDAPLFNYVTTDATIVNTANQPRTLNIARIDTDVDS